MQASVVGLAEIGPVLRRSSEHPCLLAVYEFGRLLSPVQSRIVRLLPVR